MPQPFSWQLKCQNWSLDPRGVVSAVVAVTNELSKVTKQAFTYDNPFKEMGDNYILVNWDGYVHLVKYILGSNRLICLISEAVRR